MFSEIFIRRPRFAVVISLFIMLGGVASLFHLPLEEYPLVAPPCIMVMASYPGASSQVIADTVAAPLEEQVNGVENMIYFSSQSDNMGNYTLLVTFEPGSDEDMALVNVNNAVKLAEHSLPTEVVNNGLIVVKRSSDILALIPIGSTNKDHTPLFTSNYASINIKDEIARTKGVAQTVIFGEQKYSIRIWLSPEKMKAMKISYADVKEQVSRQNVQAATGSVGAEFSSNMMQFKVDAKGRLSSPEEFGKIVIRSGEKGRSVLLSDIAEIELNSESFTGVPRYKSYPCVVLAVFKLNNANAVETMNQVREKFRKLSASFPEGMVYDIAYDSTTFVYASMEEIIITLLMTFILVVLITWLFLQNYRATIIPTVTIPVSLVGTFLFLQLFGISINTLTMFALILVIGSVVDDAICVVENCMRLIDEENLSPVEAASLTMKQISGALVATTLVVLAVYAPLAWYGGMVGTIYLQFAVTMCVALCLSTVNALTLSPALCALVLKKSAAPHVGYRLFNKCLDFTRNTYLAVGGFLARKLVLTVILFALILCGNYLIFGKIAPAFLPAEDKGALFCELILPPGASLPRTEKTMMRVAKMLEDVPGVEKILAVPGRSMTAGQGENMAMLILDLDDWSKRRSPDKSLSAIQAEVNRRCASVTDASVMVLTPPPIMGLGSAGGVSFALQAKKGQSYKELEQTAGRLCAKIMESGKAFYAFTTFEASTPMLKFSPDRKKIESMNVSISDVFNTLQTQLGSFYINDFNLYGKTYKVKMQSDIRYRGNRNSMDSLYVTSKDGKQIPLNILGDVSWVLGSRQAERFNMFTSASVMAQSTPFVSSGQLMELIENIVKKELPEGYEVSWTDMSYQEKQNSGRIIIILGMALLMAYLFLVAQYESWTLPVSVILSVATASLGGMLALKMYALSMDIYCQLGLLMLIGLTAKTAILMVEYAKQDRSRGVSIYESSVNGMRLRFRAVMMTALSFVIGVAPLLFASGAGAASRLSVGVTTFWGMLVATVFGMLFIPALYVIFQHIGEYMMKIFGRKIN